MMYQQRFAGWHVYKTGSKCQGYAVDDEQYQNECQGQHRPQSRFARYNFEANINDAHLNTLKLLKDTITLNTRITTNLSGNTLKNIEGKIQLSSFRMMDPRHNYSIDSALFIGQRDRACQGDQPAVGYGRRQV